MNHPTTATLFHSRRQLCLAGLGLFLLSACEEKPMDVYLNISIFSYLDRPIFDVFMNKTNFIGAEARAFYGSNGVMLGQKITLGEQKVTWRYADTGETKFAKNTPILKEIPNDIKWLALHIFDDDTVEITLSKGTPDELESPRGKAIIEAWEKAHGQ